MTVTPAGFAFNPLDCPSCGAPLFVSLGTLVPVCQHCGHEVGELAPVGSRELTAQFDDAVRNHTRLEAGCVSGMVCDECGAGMVRGRGTLFKCEFCGSSQLSLKKDLLGPLRPDGMQLPTISRDGAAAEIMQLLQSPQARFRLPLPKYWRYDESWSVAPDDIRAVWLPFYDFEMTLRLEPQDYARKANETREIEEDTIPLYLSGSTQPYPAMERGLNRELIPFLSKPIEHLAPFAPEALMDFHVAVIDLEANTAFRECRVPLDAALYREYREMLDQRGLYAQTSYHVLKRGVDFRLLLVPIYICVPDPTNDLRLAIAFHAATGDYVGYYVADYRLEKNPYRELIHGPYAERPVDDEWPDPNQPVSEPHPALEPKPAGPSRKSQAILTISVFGGGWLLIYLASSNDAPGDKLLFGGGIAICLLALLGLIHLLFGQGEEED